MRKSALLLALAFSQLLISINPVQAAAATGKYSLVVSYQQSLETPPQKWTIKCNPPGGSGKNANVICKKLLSIKDPFQMNQKDEMCAQIFESAEVAKVKGTWNGKPISNSYSKINGCEQARWKKISFLIQGVKI